MQTEQTLQPYKAILNNILRKYSGILRIFEEFNCYDPYKMQTYMRMHNI